MIELAIDATHEELRRLRPWLDEHLATLSSTTVGRIELCVHELVCNVIDHSGAADVRLELTRATDHLVIVITDQGEPLALPVECEVEAHPRVRGYGTMIAEQLASEVLYERVDDTNLWRVRFDAT